MKFTCENYILQQATATASRAAASKSTIPALEGLLIKAMNDRITVTGYDLKKGIYTSFEAQNIVQSGAVVVNCKLFGEIIRKLPDGLVTFSTDENNNINIRCGKTEFNVMGTDSEDYPEIPEIEEEKTITINEKLLSGMISQTIFAVATSDARPVQTGTLFEVENGQLTMVSVDGFRLAKRVEKLDQDSISDCSFVVPGNTLADVARICADEERTVKIALGQRHVSFCIDNTVIISRRLEGEFLNYRKAIPEMFKYYLTVDRTEFQTSIDRVALMVSEKNLSPVRMTFNDGSIDMLCYTPIGRATDTCTCLGSGDGMEIGFNDRYMKDALKAAGTEKLQLCLNSAFSPCVITAADGSDSFTFMILPVRLRAEK